jgi:hypothetical protein
MFKAFDFKVRFPDRGREARASGTLARASWKVAFYRWDAPAGEGKEPWNKVAWEDLFKGEPLHEETVGVIDYNPGSGSPAAKVPADRFATSASAEIELPAGKYVIRTISDDGVRVMVDGKTVLDNWTWHPPTADSVEVELSAGKHAFRVHHFEIDGLAQLRFDLSRQE